MTTLRDIADKIKVGDLLVTELTCDNHIDTMFVLSTPQVSTDIITIDCLVYSDIHNELYSGFTMIKDRVVIKWEHANATDERIAG